MEDTGWEMPRSSTHTRRQFRKASPRSWVTHTAGPENPSRTSVSSVSNCWRRKLSSAERGSSSRIARGSAASIRARATLPLAAGDLPGQQFRRVLQPEPAQLPFHSSVPQGTIPHCRGDILPDGHVGEEGVLLEKVSHRRLWGGFPAAGGPQQGQGPGLCLKLYTQVKIPKPLFHIYQKGHHAPPFRRVSSRFSASRNAAEMARFTSTHRNAPAVSPVRQSW